MIRKNKFVPNHYYHIYNRTIFSMPEFKKPGNAEKLAQAFLLANSTQSSGAFQLLRNNKNATIEDALKIAEGGEKLVDILSYAIMPNHYHLLLKEGRENGITNFIHKCNVSIAKYINIKNDRRGPLFESVFKSKYISTNDYLLHLSLYIHLNPLDFITGKEWRKHKIQNWKEIKKSLLKYPWSSLNFYLGNQNDRILSGTEIIRGQFETPEEYESFLREWSEDFEDEKNLLID